MAREGCGRAGKKVRKEVEAFFEGSVRAVTRHELASLMRVKYDDLLRWEKQGILQPLRHEGKFWYAIGREDGALSRAAGAAAYVRCASLFVAGAALDVVVRETGLHPARVREFYLEWCTPLQDTLRLELERVKLQQIRESAMLRRAEMAHERAIDAQHSRSMKDLERFLDGRNGRKKSRD